MNHNLDISNYSFYELLELFELGSKNIDIEDLKRAKKKVLFMHPDKSKLPAEYFLFYKKAFSIILNIYENTLKTNQSVPTEYEIDYVPEKQDPNLSTKYVRKNIESIDQKTFHTQFNKLFEENMMQKIDTSRNKWFEEEEPMYEEVANVKNVRQMSDVLDSIKKRNNDMILYKGVSPIQGGGGNRLYNDDDDDGSYISSDPFSKLKFEDLRKVHKDQTVFAVSERDIDKVQKYMSVEEYQRVRGTEYVPVNNEEGIRMLHTQEQLFQEKMRQKQYYSQLQTLESEEKNKKIMANFLRLT